MTSRKVSIVITQRERFSYSVENLNRLYETTGVEFELIYVDTNSPSPVREQLAQQAKEKGFRLIRIDRFLAPNQARNVGLSLASGEYLMFLDNDVWTYPNWLEKLTDCADETGASIVAPLYLEGQPTDEVVHVFGGIAHLDKSERGNYYVQEVGFARQKLAEVATQLRREKTELVETHCLLIRRSLLNEIGPFDERWMQAENIDICLLAHERGHSMFLEPEAVVCYCYKLPLEWFDLPYFFRRYSFISAKITTDHFRRKWALAKDDRFGSSLHQWVFSFQKGFRIPETPFERVLGRKSCVMEQAVRLAYTTAAVLNKY